MYSQSGGERRTELATCSVGEETGFQLSVTELSRLSPAQPGGPGLHQVITNRTAADAAAPGYIPLGETTDML